MATCDNASAPLNLIKDLSLLEKCTVNCEYKANYPICRGSALNKGDHISIKLDSCKADVTYNRAKFGLYEIRVYEPSLHSWGGEKAGGEIVIRHKIKTVIGTKPEELLVCIPLEVGNVDEGGWLDFIPIIPDYHESGNQEVSINITQWTLNSIIPKGNYYTYQGTTPFVPCASKVDIVVYGLDQAVKCSQRYFNMLKASLPKDFKIPAREYNADSRLHKLFYHSEEGLGDKNGELYLDCRDVNGDSPEDSNYDDVNEPNTSSYRGMEKGEEVASTKVPWKPLIITAGSLVGLIIVIKTWSYIRKARSSS